MFAQVLLIAAQPGLARFGTVAIDGTKIAANASIDANRGQLIGSSRQRRMVTEAEQVDDRAEDARRGRRSVDGDRVPAGPG